MRCAWNISQCSLYTVHHAVCILIMYCAVCNVTVSSVHYTMLSIKCTVWIVQCIVCSVQWSRTV